MGQICATIAGTVGARSSPTDYYPSIPERAATEEQSPGDVIAIFAKAVGPGNVIIKKAS